MSSEFSRKDEYIRWLRSQGISEGTIENYCYSLSSIPVVNEEKLEESLSNPNLPNRRNIIPAYRSYARFLEAKGHIDAQRLKYILATFKNKRQRGNNTRFVKKWSAPKDQWNGYIRKAPNQVAKFAIWLGFNFGLRLGEIIHLRVDDVDFERKLILIREHKATKNQEAWNPKYNRSREVPFNREQEKVLKKWITQRISLEHPYLLWNPRSGQYFGHPISGRSIQRWCQLIHGDLRPHVLRYSFATHYFLAGVNLKTLSLVLGHSSVAITSEYLEIDKQQGFEEMRGSMGA